MEDLAVKLAGVKKSYPHFKLDVGELELPRGQIMGFIGPNGAGKSTTIRILMGLLHQDHGEVRVLGRSMPSEQVRAQRDVGFASEDMRLYKQVTLDWHMRFMASIYPSWDPDYAATLLRRFDLRPTQKIKGLSHGQRVKAGLLLVLARRPQLLILDEPTTGLDPVARHEVLEELMDVVADEDRTVLFSSHNTLDVEQMSDQITFIDRGRIIDSRDKETFLERWRRLRFEVAEEVTLPEIPNVTHAKRSGRLVVVTTNDYDPGMTEAYHHAGATVHAVENMTLEEIFVANVQKSRQGAAA